MRENDAFTISWVDRGHWRRWPGDHHNKHREIWLIVPKKTATGISYRSYYIEALEEAICFGWIGSRVKAVDETRSMIRFTPE